MNKRAAMTLPRAELSQIPAAQVGGLLGLIVSVVRLGSGWWDNPPSREAWTTWMRLLVALLCGGIAGWLVASGSTHLVEALIALTLALALSVGLLR
jgi:hypothetical protein